jgi:hypothetical protein
MKVAEREFTNRHPTKPGQYLFLGAYSHHVEIINVVWYPPKDAYGMSWEGYLGVAGQAQRSVTHYDGMFCELVIEAG